MQWAAILVDEAAAKKGTKERIKQLLVVKDHMQKAIKYSPTDPTSLYLLGKINLFTYEFFMRFKKNFYQSIYYS